MQESARRSHRKRSLLPAWLAACLFVALLAAPLAVQAQAGGEVKLIEANAEQFPTVRLYFEAYDASGQFVRNLRAGDVQALEDESARPLAALTRLQSGVQFIVALNESPELANRTEGVSRFDAVKAQLRAWAVAQPAGTTDDFSLSGGTGLQYIRLAEPREWVSALDEYAPNLLTARSSLASISQALDLATDPNPNPFMKRAVLYVSGLPAQADLQAYPSLAARAKQLGVRISVWCAAPVTAETTNAEAVQTLRGLAEETGGEFFLFSGAETLPDLDAWLEPMRYTYQAEYPSGLALTGRYEVRVGLDDTRSNALRLDLEITPPNPIFLDPPTQIERIWSSPEAAEAVLTPADVPVQVMIEFPDGHTRDLEWVRLYVDGELALENTAAPFDLFSWDISPYTTSGQHSLQVEVKDVLGLTQRSIETPVEVIAQVRAPSGWQRLLNPDRLVGYAAIAVAGLILGLAVLLRTRALALSARRRTERKRYKDPVTQPVNISQDGVRSSSQPLPVARPTGHAAAWLLPISGDTHGSPRPIALHRKDLTIGSDAQQASVALSSPSISPLHARLFRSAEGDYWISDCGSVAGTWVNYAPTSNQGVRLEHGDLIQLGRMSYRFELAHPPQIPQPRVESVQEPYESD
jgi:hypothetical protein